ncbi:cellulase family glycosylhydrolase [Granulicella tundricola]|uniref:Mannan endo-1,4-beta-mannosidase n=1 Tax=Granulicella tundricola (strain ATCC BAA-1859 / DSM 23138 / MP5ACTX9) TaxID=1198114 RepID=E8WVG6_GRATM|nr:cellulase family glycosylhydrolase [Granulicella tundricola]ADW68414.1 mannan endo-1,4-beta-mannosidase [Granulicella tundricola MP5ACTX9]
MAEENVSTKAAALKATLNVKGRFLYDRQGNKVVLRGVDYQALDQWKYPGIDYLDEVLQTGANAIRIPWYKVYPTKGRGAFTIGNLTNLIDRCVAAKVIPIVEFADFTSNAKMSLLSTVVTPWWTSTGDQTQNGVFAALKARESCLILNLANELGDYRWAEGETPAAALSTYKTDYEKAIKAMRTAGYTCPLMIDAPDSGTSSEAFTTSGTGAALVASDPLKNVLLSAHAYWAGFDGRPGVQAAIAADLPIVIGEVANKEGDPPGNLPIYDLDGTNENTPTTTGFTYQSFLTTLLADQVGWLAWSWFPDDVDARNMSSDGSFAGLTTYGTDIVNNPTYGLKATAVRVAP